MTGVSQEPLDAPRAPLSMHAGPLRWWTFPARTPTIDRANPPHAPLARDAGVMVDVPARRLPPHGQRLLLLPGRCHPQPASSLPSAPHCILCACGVRVSCIVGSVISSAVNQRATSRVGRQLEWSAKLGPLRGGGAVVGSGQFTIGDRLRTRPGRRPCLAKSMGPAVLFWCSAAHPPASEETGRLSLPAPGAVGASRSEGWSRPAGAPHRVGSGAGPFGGCRSAWPHECNALNRPTPQPTPHAGRPAFRGRRSPHNPNRPPRYGQYAGGSRAGHPMRRTRDGEEESRRARSRASGRVKRVKKGLNED